MPNIKAGVDDLYERTIKQQTRVRLRKENRQLRQIVLEKLNNIDTDIMNALEHFPKKEREYYLSIINGSSLNEEYEKILKAQIVYNYFDGYSRSNIKSMYNLSIEYINEILKSFGIEPQKYYHAYGKAHFVVGTEVFDNIITARTYRKKNKLNYKVHTIGQNEIVLYDFMKQNQILLEDVGSNVFEKRLKN